MVVFNSQALNELLESDNKYGFIVMDGNGSLFGTLSGNTRCESSTLPIRLHYWFAAHAAGVPPE